MCLVKGPVMAWPCSGIPIISTAYAQTRCRCAQVIHMFVHRDSSEDAAGLRGQELLPGRAGAAWCGIDAGVVQDLQDRGCRDPVAEFDQLPLHPPVPQVGFSVAMRITSLRIEVAVDGRPGRRRLV